MAIWKLFTFFIHDIIEKKKAKEEVCMFPWDYETNHNENGDGNEKSHRFDINRPRSREIHKQSKYKNDDG